MNLKDYVIGFEIDFKQNFKQKLDETIQETIEMGLGIAEINNIKVDSGIGSSAVVKVSGKVSPKQFQDIVDELTWLKFQFFTSGSDPSPLAKRGIDALDTIHEHVLSAFDDSDLENITGNLRRAIETQSPVVEETPQSGIQGGLMDWAQMGDMTVPYSIKKGVVQYKEDSKRYTYITNAGVKIQTSGYWPFLEFGTSKNIVGRRFVLNLQRGVHGADREEWAKVKAWIREQVREFRIRARKAAA